MARPSARPRMIEAALRVVEERGIAALTLDAVADEAGVTKRGLIYHFPNKHALLVGIHEDLAARAERDLLECTGQPPEEASLVARTEGYVRAAFKSPTTAEMRLIMEAANDPECVAPWLRVYERWFPEAGEPIETLDPVARRCLIARMAADGSWGYQSLTGEPLTDEANAGLISAILAIIDAD